MLIAFRRLAFLTLVSVFVCFSATAFAQRDIADRAAVVVAIESPDDLINDIVFVVEAAGFEDFAATIRPTAHGFREGIDKTKPFGGFIEGFGAEFGGAAKEAFDAADF